MSFQLGTFISTFFGDTSPLEAALGKVKQLTGGVAGAIKQAGSQPLTVQGAEATAKTLEKATKAADGLGRKLLDLTGIDLNGWIKLASIGGMVAGLGAATKRYMDLQDEAANLGFRLKSLGMDVKSNTEKIWAFGKAASESFGIAASEARKLAGDALVKGINPARYQEMAGSALGLSGALGISSQHAMKVVEQLEAGNTMILRRLHPSFRVLLDQGAGRFQLEAKVNEMIAQGGKIAQERMKTFDGQINRLKNSFGSLYSSVAMALGPAFAPLVSKLADAVEKLNKKLVGWIETNQKGLTQAVQAAAATVMAALAYNHLGTAISFVRTGVTQLIPGFETLKSVLGTVGPSALFDYIKIGITGVMKGLWKMPGLLLKITGLVLGGVGMAFAQLATLAVNPLRTINGLGMGLVGVMRLLKFAVKGVGAAIRTAIAATGVGVILVLIGGMVAALFDVADTFGEVAGSAGNLGDEVRKVVAEIREFFAPVLAWIQTEAVIVFKAIVASGRQMWTNLRMLWEDLKPVVARVTAFIRETFGGALEWLEKQTGEKIDSFESLWAEFTAQLAVLGLRVRQVVLLIALNLQRIPAVIRWLGQVFKAFGEFLRDNWMKVVLFVFDRIYDQIRLLGEGFKAIGKAVEDLANGRPPKLDWSGVTSVLKEMRAKTEAIFSDIKMPKLDLTGVAPELRAEIEKLEKQIEAALAAARASQAKDRTKNQDGDGKTSGPTAAPGGGVLVGGRDKSHFSETVGFWKKVQEAAANQRVEYIAQQQLNAQIKMSNLLEDIRNGLANPTAAKAPEWPPPVVPRG